MTTLASEPAISLRRSPFEEEFLGGPVQRLTIARSVPPKPLAGEIATAITRAREAGVRLISARLSADDGDAIATLTEAGFRPIEQLITFRRDIEPVPEPARLVGPVRARDFAACIDIGRHAFVTDRYHADPAIPDAAADALKARWVENALAGRAEVVLVARDGSGRVVGFNLLMRPAAEPVIDLIAVAPSHRGRGFGRALVTAALARYRHRAVAMRVGTQRQNAPSVALYRSLGFVPVTEQVTLHWTP